MTASITLGDLHIDVVQKEVKNIHLSVYPPDGRVRIAAPSRIDLETIRVYAISKLPWIRQQQASLLAQERETEREFLDRESHYFLGRRYLLRLHESSHQQYVEIDHKYIHLYARPATDKEKKRAILDRWYRNQLHQIIPDMISKWESKMGVHCADYGIKRMKTKWGTCNPEARRIWLNLELVKKPEPCLEYIIVHELVHLLERSHNARFTAYMDQFLPRWRYRRDELNRMPYGHVDWGY